MMSQIDLSETVDDVAQLDELLSRPTPAAVAALARTPGDMILLGVGGKMGPTLARMAKRASVQAGLQRRIIGVSRFSDVSIRRALEEQGINTIQGDLLDASFVESLPLVENLIFMAGMKFGSSHDTARTWAMNTYSPALACRRYRDSRLLVFSTGNVYGFVSTGSGGSVETDPPAPIGEYAMSALGRERIVEYFSRTYGTAAAVVRLNYACELRYGVLLDLAQQVAHRAPIDLTMGYVNVIWQGDACAMALSALADAQSPPLVINVAGRERLRVRDICERFGVLLGIQPTFIGEEGHQALLSNATQSFERYGEPSVDVERMMRWIASWMTGHGPTLGKPTHFQVRDGKF
jgi:nucleoside-diphosphate-sugar epimerase